MNEKKKQTMRFSDDELSFIKGVFADNDVLIDVLRKFFFQGELTAEEQSIISMNMSPEFIRIVRKSILPEIDQSAPFYQLVDMFSNINTQEQDVPTVVRQMSVKKEAVKYLEEMFAKLNGDKIEDGVNFASLVDITGRTEEEIYIGLAVRNFLLQHVQTNLQTLLLLAGRKDENVDETIDRLQKQSKNSAK